MARVAARHASGLEDELPSAAGRIHQDILTNAWASRTESPSRERMAARILTRLLLQMSAFALSCRSMILVSPSTIEAIRSTLSREGCFGLFRYKLDDGFGSPVVAFTICTFWLVEALAESGAQGRGKIGARPTSHHRVAAGLDLRGFSDAHSENVGKFSAGLFARRPDSRGFRYFATWADYL